METVDDNAAAVRVELSDDNQRPADVTGPNGGDGGRTRLLVAVGIATALVVALIVALRPDEGRTAAGTPITAPTTTTTADGLEASDVGIKDEDQGVTTAPDSSAAANSLGDADTEFDYEQAESDAFFFSVVNADLGWTALTFGSTQGAGVLLRSIDGLRWEELPAESLPDGDLLGLDRFGDAYVIAVDERQTWSQPDFDFSTGELPEHRISVWTSLDAVNWFPSDLPTLEGEGYPYPVSFTPESYVVPMRVDPGGTNENLVEFLAPFVDAATANEVCSSRLEFGQEVMLSALLDCDGQVLATVSEADHPEDFAVLRRNYCVEAARESGLQRFSWALVARGVESVRGTISDTPAIFGKAVGGGYVHRTRPSIASPLPEECGGERADFLPGPSSISFWTPTAGPVDVTPVEELRAPPGFGFPGEVVLADDGRVFVVVDGRVFAGEPPFQEWESVFDSVDLTSEVEDHRLSVTNDGAVAGLEIDGEFWVARRDGPWEIVELGAASFATSVLVATPDFVIVSVEGVAPTRLLKIPFPS